MTRTIFTLLFMCATHLLLAQSDVPEKIWDLSNNASNPKEQEKVISEVSKFIKKHPDVSEAYEIRARAYEWVDQEKAIADYQTAIKLNPQNSNAHLGLGNVFADLQRNEEALEQYQMAMEIEPFDGVLLNMANVYENMQDYENWERTARMMTEPGVDGFVRQMGYSSLASYYKDQGDLEQALENYKMVIEIGIPEDWDFYQVAKLLIEMGRGEEACAYLQEAKQVWDPVIGCCEDLPELIKMHCAE